jgi:hypothetical protein
MIGPIQRLHLLNLAELSGYAFMRVATCVFVMLTAISGCSNSGKPVLFILPNDFTGEFQVVKDSVEGTDVPERHGEWVFEIPASGVLRVKSDRALYRWHAERARYADGRPVSCEGVGTRAGSRPTGPNSSESSSDFDGTTHTWRVK